MAEAVGGLEQLKMLYVLTASDMQAVGPGVYTEWKASLLYDLYRKTALMLEGKDPLQPMDEDSYGRVVQAVTTEAEGNCDETEVRRFLDNMPEKYLNSVPPAKIAMHMRMARQLSGSNRIVWEIEEPESLNYTEITAVSFDVPGLMSYVCGALSSKEVNILGVQAFSSKDGYAIDTFQVTDLRGNRLPQGFRLDRLRADLNSLLMGRAKASDVFHTRRRARLVNADRVALRPANISLDNEKSSKFTTLEIHTFDRPGLLYRITATCAKAGYYIHLAMITTEAYHVVDVFYLTDLEFNKLDPQQMKRLQAALEAELQQL